MPRGTEQVAKDLKLPTDEGALIPSRSTAAPADKAGLHAGETRPRTASPRGAT